MSRTTEDEAVNEEEKKVDTDIVLTGLMLDRGRARRRRASAGDIADFKGD